MADFAFFTTALLADPNTEVYCEYNSHQRSVQLA